MIQNKTKQKESRTKTIIKEKVIDILFFNIILVAPKGAVLLVVLKNQCGPS